MKEVEGIQNREGHTFCRLRMTSLFFLSTLLVLYFCCILFLLMSVKVSCVHNVVPLLFLIMLFMNTKRKNKRSFVIR